MKLIRWLFRNIILIAFVLALTYAYVYWDNLTGEDTPAGKLIAYLSTEYDEVREFLEDYNLAGDTTTGVSETVSPPDVTETATATVPQVEQPPMQQVQPAPQSSMPPQAMLQAPPRQAFRPVYPDMQEPAMRQRPPYPEPPMMQPPQSRPQLPPMTTPREPAPVAAPTGAAPAPGAGLSAAKTVSTPRELWISAREEYHRGNIDVSIRNYKEVIAASADNYDAYGELGNVYLSRGSHKEAAEAYFEAASILVKLGHVGRARSLLPMLGRLDRAKAEELNQLIMNVTG